MFASKIFGRQQFPTNLQKISLYFFYIIYTHSKNCTKLFVQSLVCLGLLWVRSICGAIINTSINTTSKIWAIGQNSTNNVARLGLECRQYPRSTFTQKLYFVNGDNSRNFWNISKIIENRSNPTWLSFFFFIKQKILDLNTEKSGLWLLWNGTF